MSGRASTALSLAELFGLALVLQLVEVGEHAVKHGSDLLDLALVLQLVEARGQGAEPGSELIDLALVPRLVEVRCVVGPFVERPA